MKNILLTGAKGGIGRSIAETLIQQGINVEKTDRADTDLCSYEDIQKLEKKIAGKGTELDWIVCAHGFIDTETNLEKEHQEDIEFTFQLNIISLVYITKLFLKHLKPGGGVIFLSSTAALSPNGRHAAYSASKAAVNAFSQAMARNRPEFSFLSICPGPTNTPMREKIAGDASSSQDPAAVANIIGDIIAGGTEYASGDIIIVRDGRASKAGNLTQVSGLGIG